MKGTDLSGAALGDANFSNADLTGANLMNADCEGARFDGTKLDQARPPHNAVKRLKDIVAGDIRS